MTPKMQEALDLLATAGNMPKRAFHHSTVTALLKGGHVEEVPGDSAWITLPDLTVDTEREAAISAYARERRAAIEVSHADAELLRNAPLPRRNPDVPVVEIDDDVIASGQHVDTISTVATPKAWIMGCVSCKMPMVEDPHHLPGCEVALVNEALTEVGMRPANLTVAQLATVIRDVRQADSDADASGWVCRGRVKASRVSRRRAQRRAVAR